MRKRRAYRRKGRSRGLLLMAGLWLVVAAAAWALGGQSLSGGGGGLGGLFGGPAEGDESGAEAGLRYLGTALPAMSRGLEEARSAGDAGREGAAQEAESAEEDDPGRSFLQGMVELSFPAVKEDAAAGGGPAADGAELVDMAGGASAIIGERQEGAAAGDGQAADPGGGQAAAAAGEVVQAPKETPPEESLPIVDSGSGGEPLVLIYHTHATESYQPVSQGNFHSLEEAGTVREAGSVLAAALRAKGIAVVHDKTIHDNPSYSQSYSRSIETAKALMAKYPTVEIVIDLHRDAAAYSGGVGKTFDTGGATAAQFSLVVGTGNGNVKQLLNFAELITGTAENLYPGFPDRIIQKDYKYNQYICDRYLLLELGNNQNTIEEVKLSARCFADVIAQVLTGG